MQEKLKFELFVPPKAPDRPLNMEYLKKITGKSYIYTSRGRHALYHILKSLKVKGPVIVPCYSCRSISLAVSNAGLKCVYCDIDIEDLNISFNSFISVQRATGADCVIVPSLYGNPADLVRFEEYCHSNNIRIIDDAAQSFGASLENRYLSTFGDGGLFAFSPGKSTPSAMGALFWSKGTLSEQVFSRKHSLIHRLIYLNYNINRQDVYQKKYPKLIKSTIKHLAIYAEGRVDIKNDKYETFEKVKMGGVVSAVLDGSWCFREEYYNNFVTRFLGSNHFRVIMNARGKGIRHKIVLVFDNIDAASSLKDTLKQNSVSFFQGYAVLGEIECFPNAKDIVGKIIELPIEDDNSKMNYLMGVIEEWEKNYRLQIIK